MPQEPRYLGLLWRSNLSFRGYTFWVSWAITSLGCWDKTHSDILHIYVVVLLFVVTFGVDLTDIKWRINKDWKDKNKTHNTKANQHWFREYQETPPFSCCVSLACLFVVILWSLLTIFILDRDCKFWNKIVKTRFMCI